MTILLSSKSLLSLFFFFNYHKDHYIQDVATFSAPPSSSYCCSFCSSSWETSGFRDEINYVLKQFCSTYYCKTDLWRQQNILRPFFTKIYRIVFSCTCWEGCSQEGRQRRQWVLLRQRYGVQPSINNKGKVFYNKGMMYNLHKVNSSTTKICCQIDGISSNLPRQT